MAATLKRWLGLGPSPAVGIQFHDDGVAVALVRADPPTVVGIGTIPLPRGTVVDGEVRRPAEAARMVDEALARIHWSERLSVDVVVEPVAGTGIDRPGLVAAPVIGVERGGGPASGELGSVAVDERVLGSALAAVQASTASVRTVEPAPVGLVRYLRLARGDTGPRFARLSRRDGRWMVCDGPGGLEVDVVDHHGGLTAVVDGPDPSRLEPSSWGPLRVDRRVRSAQPRPGLHAPVVGAALGRFVGGLSCDLVGPGTAVAAGPRPFGSWTTERIR